LFWSGGERGEVRARGECDGDCDDEGVLVVVPWDLLVVAGGGPLRRKPRSGGAARGGGECGEMAVEVVAVAVWLQQAREGGLVESIGFRYKL
jgi:hypothetical protein